ncbi:MAG TPA: YfcE family phosphodiesterase [Anaerolineae bacterium]
MPTIGIITDTHIPQRLPRLPDGIGVAFRGVELILHAGDVNKRCVLDDLNRIAPTLAVAGNADLFGSGLPARRIVQVGGRRIGLTHGHGSWPRYLWRKIVDALAREYDTDFYARAALAEFQGDRVDAVVFGHTHRPCQIRLNGVLMFNPGPVAPAYYTTRGPQVGLLHIDARGVRAEVIEL